LVAAALGALLGAFLTFVSHRAASHITPEDPMRGLAVVALMMGARFMIALTALGAYFIFARDGLIAFGPALALSFVAGLAFEAVRASSPRVSHTST
jgi:hypothetical protein